MANEYLKRTPTSSGNRKVFTWAGWQKTNTAPIASSEWYALFSAGDFASSTPSLVFNNVGGARVALFQSGAYNSYKFTATSRDVGSWRHMMMVVDTTKGDDEDRLNIYINGVRQATGGFSATSINYDTGVNLASQIHKIGAFLNNGSLISLAKEVTSDIFFVDGQALTPDVFGFYKDGDGYMSSGSTQATDFRPGQWMPHAPTKIKKDINRRGGFGVNGFYLPMNDSSNPGADFHCAPNSIIKLKGEDLPQPRNGAPTTSDAFVSQLRQETGTLGFDGVVKFDGTGDYLSLPKASFQMLHKLTSSWTIEGYIFKTADAQGTIFDTGGSSNATIGTAIYINSGGDLRLRIRQALGATVVSENFPGAVKLNRWQHIALSYDGTSIRVFVEGKIIGTTSYNTQSSTDSSSNFSIGVYDAAGGGGLAGYFTGFISNLRVIDGTALYTSNFTVPTEALTNVTNTTLLCCNSSTSATAATVSPGSITANGNAFATRNELTGAMVLAVPGITGGQGSGYGDYSADIKGSGSNKTTTASGNFAMTNLSSYYGSGMRFSGSGNSNNTGGIVSVSSHSDFNFGLGDFTLEGWINAHTNAQDSGVFGVGSGGAEPFLSFTNGTLKFRGNGGGNLVTNPNTVAIDQWHHVALESHNAVISLIVNGVVVGTANNSHSFSAGAALIGSWTLSKSYGFDGDVQDFRIYKGVAKYKGGFDVPKPYTPVGIEAFRTTTDTCKNNFATLSPLSYQTSGTYGTSYPVLTDGNLRCTHGQTGQWERSNCTMGASEGKWYFEFQKVDGAGLSGSYENWAVGLRESDSIKFHKCTDGFESNADHSYWLDAGTAKIVSNSVRGGGATSGISDVVNGDIINIAFEKTATALKVWFGKNGTYFNSGNPATGANPAVNHATTSTFIIPAVAFYQYSGQTEPVGVLNFGQNPSLSGALTAGTNADGNGKGLFKYAPPTGFLALCEDNLPTPAIADPGKHFKTVLWTGNPQSINVGFAPDLVWMKGRSTGNHGLLDSVRGATKRLTSNSTDAESTSTAVLSFDNNGFSKGTAFSASGNNYVAWCWKAGGAAVSNSDGDLTSQVSVNQDAGFSIVKFTGQGGSSSATVGHGLGKKPAFWIYKPHTNITNWYMYHQSLGASAWLNFTTTAATTSNPAAWGGVEPTSTVLTHGSGLVNQGSCILYAWAEIEGYSKFGSYVASGNADGPFVYCGFKPAWVMIKPTTFASNWIIMDSSRGPVNPDLGWLYPDGNFAEDTGSSRDCDFLSNGFKIRNGGTGLNSTNNTYIFAAFAESPFQTANAK